ncbi:hypothetical protein BOTBODRAFT_55095 [Botryobasidium botryosum FD-172 SS1]|uniref:Amino acid transporter transmembrane domain-containing protein n=1 Tax=Botryobasidium botryosum (strain FD-172 SS1) TaxID=930990 RepID=A0A067MTM0_BOTB1|nr:hypothetical protein BOTBODRAFT_55095 [Botryobasidium botryosum FD-172 SS1]
MSYSSRNNSTKPLSIGSPRARPSSRRGADVDPSQSLHSASAATPPPMDRFRSSNVGTPSPGVPNIPPRTFGSRPASVLDRAGPSPHGTPRGTPRMGTPMALPQEGSIEPEPGSKADLARLTDEEKARVLRRHLVSRTQRAEGERPGSAGGNEGAPQSVGTSAKPGAPASGSRSPSLTGSASPGQKRHALEDSDLAALKAPGGDITHSIYKWESDQRRAALRKARSASFSQPRVSINPAFEHLREPGGFRRNYLSVRASEQGMEQPPMLNNFVDFLYIFGHFAGEDLEDDEDEEDDDEDFLGLEEDEETGRLVDDGEIPSSSRTRGVILPSAPVLRQRDPSTVKLVEEAPLLPARARSSSRMRSISRARRTRRSSVADGPHGNATVGQAILMLLKAFIGTGIMFLGKAFFNGGLLFSTIVLVGIALISLYSFLLLVWTKFVVPGSYGDIGGALYGPWMRISILASIAISQIGFVATYTIFVAENLQAFIMAVTECRTYVPIVYLIAAQLVAFVPLAMIRNLAKLSGTALVADAFILIGLVYIGWSEVAVIAERGIADVAMFNPVSYPLLIGTAVFSFEGIGLVIPITDSMREPHKFPAVLTGVMLFLAVLFGGAGVLSYAAYGSDIQTVVIINLPSDKKFVQVVQFLYSVAIMLSVPLQLFPALRIMENALFTRSGKWNPQVKWTKNFFRFFIVIICALLSWAGSADLDKFVAFVGSFACIPLCYVYPAMLHYKACARTRRQKFFDILLMVFGLIAMAYTSIQTIKLMVAPNEGGGPRFGKCPPIGDDRN